MAVIDLLPTCILHIDSLCMHSTDQVSKIVKKYLAAVYLSRNRNELKSLGNKTDLDAFFSNHSLPVVNCNSVVS